VAHPALPEAVSPQDNMKAWCKVDLVKLCNQAVLSAASCIPSPMLKVDFDYEFGKSLVDEVLKYILLFQ